ncbi:F-box/kelch-repeat protein At1g16250-like [Diospyros lotus]|uniref:F-box/kelch-repeat protein At1g16250-like n=1 Tax=Diospyros lotus TaxID=55363 RepID=UPI00224FBE55|nr:F-box/kelch-repeat protein At1g16250-like [Diospyros lotus]
MGSLPSPPPPTSPEASLSRYRVYTSFCRREPGPDSNWIECYSPAENSWDYVSQIPGVTENHVLKDFAMASVGDSVYIIGGRLCRKQQAPSAAGSDDFLQVNVEIISTVIRYNIGSNQWSACAPLNLARYDFACTVSDNKIYVAGGQSTLSSARGTSATEVYDTSLDEWTILPNMNYLRYKCVGVTWEGKIHVIGGFAERGDMDKIVPYVDRSSAEVYNIQSGKWDLVTRMWQLDVPPNQIVALSDRLFSSGDCLNAWKGHIEAYDGKLNLWYIIDGSQLNISRTPIQRFFLTMAPVKTHLYFLSGHRTERSSSSTKVMVHVFDTSATEGRWKSQEPVEDEGEKELCSHCCVVQLPL